MFRAAMLPLLLVAGLFPGCSSSSCPRTDGVDARRCRVSSISLLQHEFQSRPKSKETLPTVIWGIESNAKPIYEDIVKAQLETWGKDIPREEMVVVGGKFDDSNFLEGVDPHDCGDDVHHLACKEAVLFQRTLDRFERLDADWLMVGQEDKYLWTDNVRKGLAKLDASKPQVLGDFDCGKAWKYHKDSKNGTVGFPDGWVEPQFSCEAVISGGGLCGGSTYYVSRGALALLKQKGQSSSAFHTEYLDGAQCDGWASDIYSTCLFYERGIPVNPESSGLFVGRHFIGRLQGPDAMSKAVQRAADPEMPLLGAHLSSHNKQSIPGLIRKLAKLTPEEAAASLLDAGESQAGLLFLGGGRAQ